MKDAIELFLDGLDAAIDGRGFGEEHQRAHDYVVRAVNSHEYMLVLLKQVRIQFEAEAKVVLGAEKKWNLFLDELNKVIAKAEGL